MQDYEIYYITDGHKVRAGPYFSLMQAFEAKGKLPTGMQAFTRVVKSTIKTECVE